MIQVNITTADGEYITNGIVADQVEADAYVWRMSPFWPDGFTTTVVPYTDPSAVAQAQAYLASTDWMIIRQMDIGTPVPHDVKALREAARQTINPTSAT